MDLGSLLFLLLVLACPVAMLFMHRAGGHHGHGANGHHDHGANGHHGHGADGGALAHASLDELCRRREELDAEIARRERTASAAAG